ncbi:hypothetical protein CHUAL_008890 [Chamberlinius hualienensis]
MAMVILEILEIGKLIAGLWKKIAEAVRKENSHHHLFDGTEQEGDICLQKYHFRLEHDRVRRIHKKFRYPEDENNLGNETIHGVFCYDHHGDDRGGKVWITSGGVGAKYVDIEFESMVGKGIEYTVVIMGQQINK